MDNSADLCNQEEMLLHIATLQDSQLMETCLQATVSDDWELSCSCWSNLDQDWVEANFDCRWSDEEDQTLLWTYQNVCFANPLQCDWCDGGSIASDVSIPGEDQTCQQMYDDAMLWFAIDGQTCNAGHASEYKTYFQSSGCCESPQTGAPTQTESPVDTTEDVEMDCSAHQGDVEAYISCLEQRIFRLENEIEVGRNVANEMQTQCTAARATIGAILGSCEINTPVVMG